MNEEDEKFNQQNCKLLRKFFGLIGYASYDSFRLEKMLPSDCGKMVLANPDVYVEPNEY